jgi:hypothetical protein
LTISYMWDTEREPTLQGCECRPWKSRVWFQAWTKTCRALAFAGIPVVVRLVQLLRRMLHNNLAVSREKVFQKEVGGGLEPNRQESATLKGKKVFPFGIIHGRETWVSSQKATM